MDTWAYAVPAEKTERDGTTIVTELINMSPHLTTVQKDYGWRRTIRKPYPLSKKEWAKRVKQLF